MSNFSYLTLSCCQSLQPSYDSNKSKPDFQYRSFAAKMEEENKGASAPSDLFYMKQTISNACGTVAMLHAVGNNTVSGFYFGF